MFAGSEGEGLDPAALSGPDEVFIDLYLAQVSVPSVGRNLLTPASWNKLSNRLEEGDHAILLMSAKPLQRARRRLRSRQHQRPYRAAAGQAADRHARSGYGHEAGRSGRIAACECHGVSRDRPG
ncbi:hypothetical protein LP419_13930 [Massilia sp. H-1]|nr:hypothetical protein LP419_13930 [Massilia sp. H-1]